MARHEQLWAPWRLAYVSGEAGAPAAEQSQPKFLPGADPACFICRGVAESDDRRNLLVERTGLSVVIVNRFPYNNGHLLIAPLRHQGRLDELTDQEHLDMQRLATRYVSLIERLMNGQGFNIGLNLGAAAGAGLPGHLHWHVVPRWAGDTNFMPAMAAVRVIPQSLDALWEMLREANSPAEWESRLETIAVGRDLNMDAPLQSILQREQALLAPYAMHSAQSAGREYPEPDHPYRGPFQRDRDRIVHSAAYRRLSAKTQVFTGELGDYHRTRLTHTLEVASVARTIGRALALNEDLIEALALIHDLGHPPFGHSGEDLLDECLRAEGGFSHNAQALRIVRELETRYHEFPGLNLTREVLDSQSWRIRHDEVQLRPLLEAQVVEAADSITYDTHDADDALELGLLSLDELLATPLWAAAAARVRARTAALAGGALRRAVLHELIDWQVGDLLVRASRRLAVDGIDSPQAARQATAIVVASPELAEQKKDLESFLSQRVYRHPDVLAHRRTSQALLRAMFDGYLAHGELLPEGFRGRAARGGLRRAVGDYLAGMTDRFASREFERLFAVRPRD